LNLANPLRLQLEGLPAWRKPLDYKPMSFQQLNDVYFQNMFLQIYFKLTNFLVSSAF